ncbi:hypothetical protein SOVF_150690, partial [Spinacia oleracea]
LKVEGWKLQPDNNRARYKTSYPSNQQPLPLWVPDVKNTSL